MEKLILCFISAKPRCENVPCENGVCFPINDKSENYYRCECKGAGYTGKNCLGNMPLISLVCVNPYC